MERLRPSNIVMSFGPGALLDMPGRESYIVMGTDFWYLPDKIYEKRLADEQKVKFFGSPLSNNDDDNPKGVAVSSFPHRKVCPRCNRMAVGEFCYKCKDEKGKPTKTMAPRLVAACEMGHIEDFPWQLWIGCKCQTPDLYLEGEATDSEGSDLRVSCRSCKRSRDLVGALGELKSLSGYKCAGRMPWLGIKVECDKIPHGLMRGSSNVYFPVHASALSIPPFSSGLHKLLKNHFISAQKNHAKGRTSLERYITGNVELSDLIESGKYTVDDIVKAFDQHFLRSSSNSIKGDEWDSLLNPGTYGTQDDFRANELDIKHTKLERWFDKIVQVQSLREVLCLRGFTRVEPFNYSPEDQGRIRSMSLEDVDIASIKEDNPHAFSAEREHDKWLPGIEMYGEGIFFAFDMKAVDAWLKEPGIEHRLRDIIAQPNIPYQRDGLNPTDPRFVLVHTFAHHFIRQVYLSCGYPTAALRERLYVDRQEGKEMCGVLIFTASMDSEGSLGGLVSQADDTDTVLRHIQEMLAAGDICSQDPLCMSHDPTITRRAWGASCHSCTQLPETSCEGMQNKCLDRVTLVGGQGLKGYFQ